MILDEGTKTAASLEFDIVLPASSRRKLNFGFNLTAGSKEISARSNKASTSNTKTGLVQDSKVEAHRVVDAKSSAKDRSTAVAELEDKMSVPHAVLSISSSIN